ncbi:hypothetical protein GYMLUDRAFT_77865 [Collybiopsis luxurians FD-317 M1]|uniref:Unplaced genomic scaffold GYMLUscaffold_96, whole genome shotgun sequence n=1 Tax=Collybiopsis luxurians FD-317 M1 TaxID=944289 RepID=A0A0D0BCY4_9AGAR|nr:hypothetical protein GYMLUDRAFT_77865 [Collybiopsis luxurians FD-317 M1]
MRFNIQKPLLVLSLMLVVSWALPHVVRVVKQYPDAKWILQEYEHTLTPADKNALKKKLTGVQLGSLFSEDGLNNNGLYTFKAPYKGHPADSIILKTLKAANDEACGEVKALGVRNQLVDSGMFKVKNKEEPVIIMKKVSGGPLMHEPAYKATKDHDAKDKMKQEAIDLMCQKVAHEVQTHGILHHDNRIENIHVMMSGNKVVGVEPTDYGTFELFTADKSTPIDVIVAFCKKHWTPVDWFVQADFE